jgi:hypothetical protein
MGLVTATTGRFSSYRSNHTLTLLPTKRNEKFQTKSFHSSGRGKQKYKPE